MNSNTSIGDLCCLFCCPPWPSKVVAKLAFLPPTASYKFIKLKDNSISQTSNLDRNAPLTSDDCIEDNTLSPTGNDNAPQDCQHKEKKNKESRKSQNLDKKNISTSIKQKTSSSPDSPTLSHKNSHKSSNLPQISKNKTDTTSSPLNTQLPVSSTNAVDRKSSSNASLKNANNLENNENTPSSPPSTSTKCKTFFGLTKRSRTLSKDKPSTPHLGFQAPPSPPFEYKLQPVAEPNGHVPYEFDDRQIQPFFVKSKRGTKLACTYIRYTASRAQYTKKPSQFVILFSHGNAVDIGQMPPFYLTLAAKLKTDIMSYDYSGYGLSGGTANEANLYTDIRAAYKALKEKFNYEDRQIILYGQSIGTVPTIDLASSPMGQNVAACVLHSPLLSGIRVIVPNAKKTSNCFDPFPSIDKVGKISSNVLVIHGTEDEVIDFTHGLQIYDLAMKTVDPLWVEGAGHNDIEYYPVYLQRLNKLMAELKVEYDSYEAQTAEQTSSDDEPPKTPGTSSGLKDLKRRVTPHKIRKNKR